MSGDLISKGPDRDPSPPSFDVAPLTMKQGLVATLAIAVLLFRGVDASIEVRGVYYRAVTVDKLVWDGAFESKPATY